MNFTSNYKNFRQNAYKKKKTTGDEFTDEFINALDDEHYQQYEELAPVKKQTQTTTKTEAPVKEEKDDKKWYDGFLQLGDALSDGYQFGDITKTLLGTDTDIATNVISGVVGWGEDVLDAGATLAGKATEALGMHGTAEKLRSFAEEDQYDAQEVSRKILSSNLMSTALGPLGTAVKTIFTLDDWLNSKEVDNGFGGKTTVREDNSVLGDTSDSMIQSAGEIVAKKGLQMATGGFPIADIITGVTVFGNQAEQALREDATFDEAIGSGLISAGAEIIFEKLSDGIKFGNTTLDGKLTKLISDNISKIAVRNGIHLLKDIAGESLEEVATEFFSRLGTALYKEEDLSEILGSEEAINSYIQSAITGGLMGGGFSGSKAIGGWKGNYDYKTGQTNTKQTDKTEVADEPITEETEPQTPEKNVFQNEMEKLTEQTKNTIPEDGEEKIAKIIIDEPAAQEKPSRTVSQARNLLVDKQSAIEDLSIKTGNRELMAKADYLHRVKNAAQRFINKGADGTRAINDIRKEVQKSGIEQEFQDYLYHALNIDRMSLKANADAKAAGLAQKFGKLTPEQIYAIASEPITKNTKPKRVQTIKEAQAYRDALETKNKPVFSDSITADMSRTEVEIAEKKHPEFKRWARELYDITEHLRDMMVDAGVISQDTADLFAEMYPHYIPVRRLDKGGSAVTVPLDTNKTGVNAPIKRATGGNSDIGNVFNTLAQRVEQTYTAVAKNSLGIELKNTLGVEGVKKSATVDEINDNFEKHDELLKKGENGLSPTFTVFENGERVEFEISEDIFDALKPTNEILAKEIKLLNTFSKIQRGLLTQYNPLFTATNAIKDAQSVLLNSQHAVKTYANMPKAVIELAQSAITKQESQYIKEYREHGGEDLLRFDSRTNKFIEDSKGVKKALGLPLKIISDMNEFIETIPRLAEYIASRENGSTIEGAMLDAARVTTNFAAGGDLAKFLNRNGFTFFNASIQGLNQQVRNIREAKAKGKIGVLQVAAKYAVAGLPVVLFNALAWGDDEEYEELPDYIKDGYYIIGKDGDTFIRIPKGREVAVIQNVCEQMKDQITGDDNFDFARFTKLFLENLAPQNPIDNNVIAPFIQTHTNKTWYGEQLVPTRLEDLPKEEQFDESTDALSKWLGDVFDLSPYRLNYLIGQLSGGIGDVFMPMMTPQAENGDDSLVGNMIAPFKDKFTTNATVNNKNVGDFYDKVDDLTKKANSSKATDEDTLKYKYMNTIKSQMNELYQAKRELQNSDLSNEEKHKRSMEIQNQIVEMMRNALDSYEDVSIDGVYATVGDIAYTWHVPEEGSKSEPAWQKITDKQLEKQEKVTKALGITPAEYWENKAEYDYAYEQPQKYRIAQAVGGYETYREYTKGLNDITADKDALGNTVSGSRQKKVVQYINTLDADYGVKLLLYKSEYKSDNTYNKQIVEYLNGRKDISKYQRTIILSELGMTVTSDGRVTWD